MKFFADELTNIFGDELRLEQNLSSFTTMGVGGPAQYFVTVNNDKQMLEAVKAARKYNIPFLILGKGSNVIISDHGIRGLVIVNNILTYETLEKNHASNKSVFVQSRHANLDKSLEIEKYGLSWDKNTSLQYIKVGTGWKLIALINKLIQQGITGLEWFYGIAGSVGGAVYMNVHGGAHQFFSNFIESVDVINEDNKIETFDVDQLAFDYDSSIFHKRKLIMTQVLLKLYKGDLIRAQKVINQWGKDKIIKQPQRSSGCMFQNLPLEKQEELNLPTPSMGYIIDKVLHLSGTHIGGALISKRHSAFIENTGNARASDIKKLVDLIITKTKEKFGIEPKLEVEFIGKF